MHRVLHSRFEYSRRPEIVSVCHCSAGEIIWYGVEPVQQNLNFVLVCVVLVPVIVPVTSAGTYRHDAGPPAVR